MRFFKGGPRVTRSLASVAFLGFCLPAAGAAPDVELRIIGGEPAPDDAWPFAAQVLIEEDNRSGFCGGSVVDERWVLTAGHCVTDNSDVVLPPESFSVVTGTRFRNGSGGTETEVTEVVLHPNYFVDRYNAPHNDIALLRLGEAVEVETVGVVEVSPAPGASSVIIGWGRTSPAPNAGLSPILLQAEVPVVSNEDCNAEYGGIITDEMLCAGYLDGTADSCIGDSGGPLMVMRSGEYRVAGIVSFGQECASTYGVYTRVSEFFDWFIEILDEGSDGDGGSGAFGSWWFLGGLGSIVLVLGGYGRRRKRL